jgi:urease accessory protein
VIRAFPGTDGSSLAHLHNVSGGVLAGDRLALCIDVGPNCAAQVTSTSATRLYRHRNGSQESQQDIQIQVGEDALLEYLPDALIPFAGARYSQQTSITLGSNSTLIWWETLAPGRQAMGEAFAFERLHIRSELRSPLRPLLLENFELKPGQRSMASAARFGPYTHMTNFYACKVGLPAAAWRELERMLNEFCGGQSRSGATIWGATTLVADGVAVRGLSVSAREIPATLIDCWRIVRRFLTGTEAEPPRKVY